MRPRIFVRSLTSAELLALKAGLRARNDAGDNALSDLIWTGKNAIWRNDSKPLCFWDIFRSPLYK